MSFSGQTVKRMEGKATNQPFYPDLLFEDFVIQYAIPQTSPETLRIHLTYAFVEVNFRLEKWRLKQVAAGFDSLEKVPSDNIGDTTVLKELYFRAVYCKAKALVLRDYPSIDRKQAAENQARSSEETEAVYEMWSNEAINKITGQSDVMVALI